MEIENLVRIKSTPVRQTTATIGATPLDLQTDVIISIRIARSPVESSKRSVREFQKPFRAKKKIDFEKIRDPESTPTLPLDSCFLPDACPTVKLHCQDHSTRQVMKLLKKKFRSINANVKGK